MGIFGSLKNMLSRKKEPELSKDLEAYPTSPLPTGGESISLENLKAKIDLMLVQIDSLKIEYESINQRIQNIERMTKELYMMAKS